jgi:hypothetical protein
MPATELLLGIVFIDVLPLASRCCNPPGYPFALLPCAGGEHANIWLKSTKVTHGGPWSSSRRL